MVEVGQHVVFVDPVAVEHDALVTAVWSEKCINIVYVSGDETRSDTYGRQIERNTSVNHVSQMPTHGNYWKLPTEVSNPIVQPVQR